MTAHRTAGPAPTDVPRRHDGLLLLDVDEVVLHFIAPFCDLLREYGAHLRVDGFRLTGNVRSIATGAAISGHELDRFTERLYGEQETRQQLVAGCAGALAELGEIADVVFLTAMTPTHYACRRRLLDAAGLRQPMIATERSKGAVAAELMLDSAGPLVFVDDLPPNLASVRRSVPHAHLVHLMASDLFRAHLPPLPEGAIAARDWPDAVHRIRPLFAGSGLPDDPVSF